MPKKLTDAQLRHVLESQSISNEKIIERDSKVKARVRARKAEIVDFLQNWESKTAAERWTFTQRALTVLLQDMVDEA